jgi:hypothetical protein
MCRYNQLRAVDRCTKGIKSLRAFIIASDPVLQPRRNFAGKVLPHAVPWLPSRDVS